MKKHLRRIPDTVLAKIRAAKSEKFVVGCAAKFKAEDLKSGKLNHLGVILDDQGLHIPASAIPPATAGKFSDQNINGLEVIRKDLPKERHYRSMEAPNWGNSYSGTHSVDIPYDRYPREFLPPRELLILMECRETRPGLLGYVISFKVDEVLVKTAKDFERKLFENLNILQENVGAHGVEPADVSISDYAKSLYVTWELLPPGTREETIERLFRGRSATSEEKKVAGDRHDFFTTLKPRQHIFGTSGFRRYFGALLEDNLVVFENMQYGNAVYVLFEKWEVLSKKSRIELLSGNYEKDFVRVIHTDGWKGKIRVIVKERRGMTAKVE